MKGISLFISEQMLFLFSSLYSRFVIIKCGEFVNMWCSIKQLTKIQDLITH